MKMIVVLNEEANKSPKEIQDKKMEAINKSCLKSKPRWPRKDKQKFKKMNKTFTKK